MTGVEPAEKPRTHHVREAARVFGVSPATIYRMVAEGALPCIKFGKRIVIPSAVIERMLAGGNQSQAPKL